LTVFHLINLTVISRFGQHQALNLGPSTSSKEHLMTSPWEVVVASSDPENCKRVTNILAQLGVEAICASTVEQCREVLNSRNIGLVFCDHHLPGGNYRGILAAVAGSEKMLVPKVVVMSATIKSQEYLRAKVHGVLDMIPTPCRPSDIACMLLLAKSCVVYSQSIITPMTPAI
jgi:DNA-binding NtrC family response regulator